MTATTFKPFPNIKVKVIKNPKFNGPVTEDGYTYHPHTFKFINTDESWQEWQIRVCNGPDEIWTPKLAKEMGNNFHKVWKKFMKAVNTGKISKRYWTELVYAGQPLGLKFETLPADIDPQGELNF